MATRAVIDFTSNLEVDPGVVVYNHWDGYPENIIPLLERFFSEVEAQTKDTRFSDSSMLAARFVVYLAGSYADDSSKPLDFLSVRLEPSRVNIGQEYSYRVVCDSGDRPKIYMLHPVLGYVPYADYVENQE